MPVSVAQKLEETFSISISDDEAERLAGGSDLQAGMKNITVEKLASLVNDRKKD